MQFAGKWGQASGLTERAAAQQHFLDLCALVGQPGPAEADPVGTWYVFEKGVQKVGGGKGFADVWRRGCFAFEYKGRGKSLVDAYQQLLRYREDLENPPLLVVCDLHKFEVHTNFTGAVKRVFAFTLLDLSQTKPTPTCALPPLAVLRALWEDPNRLRPDQTTAYVTREAAASFGALAGNLQSRGHEGFAASRLLIRLLFCLFAEDIGLLPERLFTKLVENTRTRPEAFAERVGSLFEAMADGGSFGADDIKHFNGGLFADATALPLTKDDLAILSHCARLDWASIEPSIFGTLFERSLDPAKRAQLGAHYTSREDILLIVEPVLMAPLRRRWAVVQAEAASLASRREATGATGTARTRLTGDLSRLLQGFAAEIAAVRVLDPACGSGNFLYVALRELLDLEKEVITFAIAHDAGGFFPQVGPEQMHGIEINPYAHELAPVTVWIGYIQWLKDNGFGQPGEPILRQMDTIASHDAVLGYDAAGKPVEPAWPEADVIIGNPPFLGDKKMRSELGGDYVEDLRRLYEGRVPGGADFVMYWFERSRALIDKGEVLRAGLLATNSIRGGQSRKVLERIKASGDIFMAFSDRPWVLEGAAVRVSMVGFDNGTEIVRALDEQPVATINADLTAAAANLTSAKRLPENALIAFVADVKGGPFDISAETAATMLASPTNVNGRPNRDVVRPWVNGLDVTRRPRNMWIIDFGSLSEEDASLYEVPFEYVKKHVFPLRSQNRKAQYARRWWIHSEPCNGMREAVKPLYRYIATPTVAKHRLFAWLEHPTLADHQLIVFARDDDYFFGVLHSKIHELWALRMGTSLEDRPRYTPTSTFETFPFPWPPGQEPADSPLVAAIADAARELNEKRERWLNPAGATADELKRRTLTNLYNERPSWLANLHTRLDAAALAAYRWAADLGDEGILEGLLGLNRERYATKSP